MSGFACKFILLVVLIGLPQATGAAESFSYEAFLREAWRDCAADRTAYCSGVPMGGGRIVNCLVNNADKLSGICRKHVDAVTSANRAWESCQADIESFCPSVQPGSGRILACLSGNRDRISKPCLTGLKQAEQALKYY
jgi:Cysteine rich repeat